MSQEPYWPTDKLHPYFENPYSTDERKKIIGKRLQEIRNKYHLKQTEISKIIGVTAQTYNGYEKGRYEPSAETLIRLAYLYDTTTDFLTAKNQISDTIDYEAEEYIKTFDPDRMADVSKKLDRMEMEIADLKRRIKESQE